MAYRTDTPPYSILIVDDKDLIRLSLAEYLRDCGYRVLEASQAAKAKAALEADPSIKLIFSDVNMPGENGFALAEWVCCHHAGTKVLLTSGFPQPVEKTQSLPVPLLKKPYTYAAVECHIRSALQ